MLTSDETMLTTGDSPETVIDSSSAPTFIDTFSSTVAPTATGIPSRFSVPKPVSVYSTLVSSRRQDRKPVDARFRGHDGRRAGHAGAAERDGHTRQHAAGLIDDLADDFAGGPLCGSGHGTGRVPTAAANTRFIPPSPRFRAKEPSVVADGPSKMHPAHHGTRDCV